MIPRSDGARVGHDCPVHTYLPENLDLSFIAAGRRDAAAYFVGRLYLGQHVAGRDPDEFQAMYSPLLKAQLGSDYRREVIDPLLEHGVIEEDSSYSTGWKGQCGYSRSYRLAPAYRQAQFRVVPFTHHEFVKRLASPPAGGTTHAHLSAPVHRHLARWFDRLSVAPSYPADVLPLRAWAEGHRRFWPCRYGRVHSNLTNLRREYRYHLTLDSVGEPLVGVDVKTSQPLLLGLAVLNWVKVLRNEDLRDYSRQMEREWAERVGGEGGMAVADRIPYLADCSSECLSDTRCFVDVCLKGDLYSRFVSRTGLSRDQVKKRFLATLYDRPPGAGGVESDVVTAFRQEFPGLWVVLDALKRGNHAPLPCYMQTVESWLVIWRTCGRLAEELPDAPLLTIHDCLVTTERYVEPVRRALLDEFDAVWGVRPQADPKALAA
ncbi:hypothetical protein [Urbifossiella limnaea]|uniref:DNA-directed DNA polymerase family A palm domain-containing protein n=1 Tax=Urbifossiella limnaea TaxID=2528023 RepID=A0A517XLT7_9BACT|nr:hypothetical protein [Urbifossiella limnaea]QDU18468.1 hypothetical protein ETAA1_03560 [Urbifossiella limnaea]